MPVDGLGPLLAVPLAALLAERARAMSARGAVAGTLVGWAIVAGAGWAGFFMLLALVVFGTLVSSRAHRNRGVFQALCNGGVAVAGALAAGLGAWWGIGALAGALATALSDTVAGEIGRRFGGPPRVLLLGPRVASGADGGMTWLGTLAGVAAAFPVPLLGAAFGALPGGRAVLLVAAAGVLGNVADSVLGRFVQPRLGAHGNDLVNLFATAAGAAAAVALTS